MNIDSQLQPRGVVMKKFAYVVLMLVACGESGVSIRMTATNDAPAYGDTPFPTDAVRDGDRLGVIRGIETLVVHHEDIVAAQVAALDGFGLRPLVEFPVEGKLDPATIPARTNSLVDIDPN